MALSEEDSLRKRPSSPPIGENDNDEDIIGPLPTEAVPRKKKKVLEYEQVYLSNLPCAKGYERSFMHRDVISHVAVTKSDFIITASVDSHVKFWKKCEGPGIEFVKHFRCHLGTLVDLAASVNGELCCTIADDKTLKVFDVVNFDMINMMKLNYVPSCCCWIFSAGDPVTALAVGQKDSPLIHVYDGKGSDTPLMLLEKLHFQPVINIKYNNAMQMAVSVDSSGIVEYWHSYRNDCKLPTNLPWESKMDTDLFDFMKHKCIPTSISFSNDGKTMATLATDRKVRIFKFETAKITKVIDESVQQFKDLQKMKEQIPNMEFARRLAVERDLEKTDSLQLANIVFDESGNFILYGTMLGIKVVNLHTNSCSLSLGKQETPRFLHLGLFQGAPKKSNPSSVTIEMAAANNPSLQGPPVDPILFCTAYKKNRFYMFSRREPGEKLDDTDRDVFNEKPSKEEMAAATRDVTYTRISDTAVIHTTLGDIHVSLYPKECPKTVENFCVHSRNGYYNGHIFHRIIKGFMLQTGDPLGTGTGGESIWGGEFEDEFHPKLRHNKPYMLSMANAGPNTNGSQFFVTVVPTPWLDNKHTVFGTVTKGMEVCQNISNVKTDAKTDKPYDDIRIISITLK